MTAFSALRCGPITLYLIDSWNLRDAAAMVCRCADRGYFHEEFWRSYVPAFNEKGVRTKWGFYARLDGKIAGLSLLGIDDKDPKLGYTGADTMTHMRGKGVAPGSKPALFHLGFKLLGLKKIETGCSLSNAASKRSIEKTQGFEYVGVFPGRHPNDHGEMEDEHLYAITRESWKKLYAETTVDVLR